VLTVHREWQVFSVAVVVIVCEDIKILAVRNFSFKIKKSNGFNI